MIKWESRKYITDPYRTRFEADVVERIDGDAPAVVLSETYFYPESGGQPCDLGTIGGKKLVDVQERPEDGAVVHSLVELPQGDRVDCEIDWPRRLDHMQQHSGQHMLSAALLRKHEAQTLSFHLGSTISTIDLDRSLDLNACVEAEGLVNAVIQKGVSIQSRLVSGTGDLDELELRKAPPESDELRIVTISDFDQQACCGTHPANAAEVGVVMVRSVENYKGGCRVSFVCGNRARRDYRESVDNLRAVAAELSSAEADTAVTVQRLLADKKQLGKDLAKLDTELVRFHAEEWFADATRLGAIDALSKVLDAGEVQSPGSLRTAALHLVARPNRIVLLGTLSGGRAHLVFARSKDGDADMGALLRSVVYMVDGKGGGSAELAQGGGPKTEGLTEAMAEALDQTKRSLA